MAPPHRPPPRTYTVLGKRLVTPNMLRVTLGGPGMDGFPPGRQGGYIKLRVPSIGDPDRLVVRTYTISAQRQGELDVDFALHGGPDDAGPATRWALTAVPGTNIEAGGPGEAKPLDTEANFHLIAGDMTSLPAIACNLAALPAHARGHVVIEIASDGDRQDIACPEGMEIVWLVNPQPGSQPDLLASHLRAVAWPDGQVHGWAACEFSAMRALRSYLRDERGLGPDRLYISSYWKAGLTEEDHREAKRSDAQGAAG